MGWLYLLLLVLTVGFVLTRGGAEERIAIMALLGSSLATFALFKAGLRFDTDLAFFSATSLVHLMVVLIIAYRSARFWPLLYAALQIVAVLSPLSSLFAQNLVTYALGVLQGFWAYPQLLILVLAALRRTVASGTSSPIS